MHIILIILLLAQFNISPLPQNPEEAKEPEYTHLGLIEQISTDEIIISEKSFRYRSSVGKAMQILGVQETNADNLRKTDRAEQSKPTAAALRQRERNNNQVNTDLPTDIKLEASDIDIYDAKGNSITLSELMEQVPVIVKFHSDDYEMGANGPFSIDRIKVEQEIPKDIPDSLYNRKAKTLYEKWRQSQPK